MNKTTFSPTFQKKLTLLRYRDRKLYEKVKKQLKIFQVDMHHPSLRTHKLKGKLNSIWSISVTMSLRLFFMDKDKSEYYFFDVGMHDEMYK